MPRVHVGMAKLITFPRAVLAGGAACLATGVQPGVAHCGSCRQRRGPYPTPPLDRGAEPAPPRRRCSRRLLLGYGGDLRGSARLWVQKKRRNRLTPGLSGHSPLRRSEPRAPRAMPRASASPTTPPRLSYGELLEACSSRWPTDPTELNRQGAPDVASSTARRSLRPIPCCRSLARQLHQQLNPGRSFEKPQLPAW